MCSVLVGNCATHRGCGCTPPCYTTAKHGLSSDTCVSAVSTGVMHELLHFKMGVPLLERGVITSYCVLRCVSHKSPIL